MSKAATREYILRKQEDYIGELDRRRRGRILDEVCRTTGLERKYASRLLKGSRRYRRRRARGKAHGAEAETLLVQAWTGAGCPNSKYLKAMIGKILEDLSELQFVRPETAAEVLRMSASTMERILRGRPRTARVWPRRNRRSGRNEVKDAIPCVSGERPPARKREPGYIQVDSVAFCGGFAEGDYFWAATATDVRTQWFEARPSYNLNAANYAPAFRGNLEAFPFTVTGIHSDNGPELVNAVIYRYETGRWPKAKLGRSWPGRKNHNAHIEQKNGSVLRTFVGDVRLAHPGLQRSFGLLLEAICLYNNYFRPCVMLTSKSKRRDGKGYRCRYDEPRTPAQRALESGVLTAESERRIRQTLARTNGVRLMELIGKRYRRLMALRRLLEEEPAPVCAVAAADSALRAAPPGPSAAATAQTPARRPGSPPSPAGRPHAEALGVHAFDERGDGSPTPPPALGVFFT